MSDLAQLLGVTNSDLSYKAPCRVASTGPLTLSGYQTIDGVTLASGDSNLRVLVKDQADATQNGIYHIGISPVTGNDGYWSLDGDCDFTGDLGQATAVRVQYGNTNSGVWYASSTDPIVLGNAAFGSNAIPRTALNFTQVAFYKTAALTCVFYNGEAELQAGMVGQLEVPFTGTITMATLVANAADNLTVDVRKCTYSQYDGGVTHPVAGDSITGSFPLTLANAVKYQDSTLSGWTTSVAKGDILQFIVTVGSPVLITRATASLRISRPLDAA